MMSTKLRTTKMQLTPEGIQMIITLLLLVNSQTTLSIKLNEMATAPLEHRVTFEDAKAAASNLLPHLMIESGCKECTETDNEYCMGKNVLHDHCCCDRKFHEVFPYMEHACYKSSNSCEPIARDCGEYHRLLVCCCHHKLGSKWKKLALGRGDLLQLPNALIWSFIIILELV